MTIQKTYAYACHPLLAGIWPARSCGAREPYLRRACIEIHRGSGTHNGGAPLGRRGVEYRGIALVRHGDDLFFQCRTHPPKQQNARALPVSPCFRAFHHTAPV